MDDLKKRLRDVEGFAPPDLWKEITSRESRPLPPELGPGRRIAAGLLALAVAAAGLAFVVRAFRADRGEPQPATEADIPAKVTASVTGKVRLEGIPGSVAAAGGSVWVATYDYQFQQAAIVHIDAATSEVIGEVPVESEVYNIAADARTVWAPVGVRGNIALLRIDASTHEVTGRVEGIYGPVVVDPTRVWAVEDGPDERDTAVVRIDPESLAIEARVPVGEAPLDMASGAGSIWLDARTGDLLRIDASSAELAAPLPIKSGGPWIAADNGGVWASAWDPDQPHDSKAFFIDASTNAVSGEPGDVYNFRPFAVAEGRVWFISGPHDPGLPDGGVCGLNVETRSVDVCVEPDSAPNLEFAHDPAAFEPDTDTIWLGEFDEPWVTRIDLVSADQHSPRRPSRPRPGSARTPAPPGIASTELSLLASIMELAAARHKGPAGIRLSVPRFVSTRECAGAGACSIEIWSGP